MAKSPSGSEFEQAVKEFDHVTRPVVHKAVELARQSLSQAEDALQLVQANVDKIGNAALKVATAQADVIRSGGRSREDSSTRKRSR